jgi:lactoylglutathione lyase
MRTLHVGVLVSDPARSVAFYRALGYEVVGHVPETGLGALTMLKLPADEFVSLELVHRADSADVRPGGFSHLVVAVEDVHALAARLRADDVEVEAPASPDGSDDFWTAWITDPDGYRLELVQWPPGHPVGMTRADLAPPDTTSIREENDDPE